MLIIGDIQKRLPGPKVKYSRRNMPNCPLDPITDTSNFNFRSSNVDCLSSTLKIEQIFFCYVANAQVVMAALGAL